MRKLTLTCICLAILFTQYAHANNIRVENVAFYKSDLQPAGTIDIKFDVIWDNPVSGTDANSQAFFDRAWIFVKFWDTTKMGDPATGGDGAYSWGHGVLTTGGSLSTYSDTTHTGLALTDGTAVGAFADMGTNKTVRWNYAASLIPGTANYVASTDTVKVRVMAIEMVHIPEGPFWVGDASSTSTIMDKDDDSPALIGTTASVIYSDDTDYDDAQFGQSGPGIWIKGDGGISRTAATETDVNTSFPTGYNAFYIMKYDITQGQYRDFLNMLSRAAQNTRTGTSLAAGTTSVTNRYVMSNTSTLYNRQGIRCDGTINTSNAIIFYCDLNGNNMPNEADDGEWIACNYLSWMDVAAYADWAGLRPMTELEFEKACRGGSATDNTVANEYAWGNTVIDYYSDLTDSGTISEVKGPTRPDANCNYSSSSPSGPVRSGMFATAFSTRAGAGASYYGVMELSGNLWKRLVTVGNSGANGGGGRLFAGTHGDGVLTGSEVAATYRGNATNTDWPGIYSTAAYGVYSGASGSGSRGGSWYLDSFHARVSHRSHAASGRTERNYYYGGRLSRTSP